MRRTLKSHLWLLEFVLSVVAIDCVAQDRGVPEGPKVATTDYWLAVIGGASATYADAYTTAHYVGHTRNCDVEGWSPWLYGRKAPDARVFAVMTTEVAANSTLSFFLKKRRSKLWMVPLVAMGTAHGLGAAHNASRCPE